MSNCISTHIGKDCISISIDLSDSDIKCIAERINEFHGGDYSDIAIDFLAFLADYLRQNDPAILDTLKVVPAVPGTQMCCAYLEGVNDENKLVAEKLVQIVEGLADDEEKVSAFLEQYPDDIDWNQYECVTRYNIGSVSQFWICDYVVYGLYLGAPDKFLVSPNEDSPIGPRKTGANSGYFIEVKYNNQGVEDPVTFQITSVNADKIHVQGGIPGTNYIDADMDANSAIQLLLSF